MSKPQAKITRLKSGTLVAVYGKESPADDEWKRYLSTIREIATDDSLLIFSWGGGPSMKQRRELEEAVKHHEGKVAVVTESRVARGIVKAIGWTGKRIRAFDFGRRKEAFEYLGLTESQQHQVLRYARLLAEELQLEDASKLAG